jgi:hypothetical protein
MGVEWKASIFLIEITWKEWGWGEFGNFTSYVRIQKGKSLMVSNWLWLKFSTEYNAGLEGNYETDWNI